MKILVIGKVHPEPDSSAAGRNMMQLLALLQRDGELVFVTPAQASGHESDLTTLGIRSESIRLNDPSTLEYLRAEAPDIVVFDRFMTEEQFGWQVAEACPDALRILNTEDLHFLRKARQTAVKKHGEPDVYTDEMARELAAIYRCDLSLIISVVEMELLTRTLGVPETLLFHLPLLSDGPKPGQYSYSERKDCIFIGNFLHEPNLDAVRWLRTEIWPRVQAINPSVRVHVYGAYPTQEVMEMHRPEMNFLVHGRAAEVGPLMNAARINLAPLRFGAGMKGKILDAMEWGTPTVSTAIGFESMTSGDFRCGVLANDPDQFARILCNLYADEEAWRQLHTQAPHLLSELFDTKTHTERLVQRLKDLSENRETMRKSVPTAWIIRQQALWASRYMAKWIMEKNK